MADKSSTRLVDIFNYLKNNSYPSNYCDENKKRGLRKASKCYQIDGGKTFYSLKVLRSGSLLESSNYIEK